MVQAASCWSFAIIVWVLPIWAATNTVKLQQCPLFSAPEVSLLVSCLVDQLFNDWLEPQPTYAPTSLFCGYSSAPAADMLNIKTALWQRVCATQD
jgi:hypothetical protein